MGRQKNILIAGAGRIGQTIAAILSADATKNIFLLDITINNKKLCATNVQFIQGDINDHHLLGEIVLKDKISAIVSCLPYFCNIKLAEFSKKNNCHYFDLTEDIFTTQKIFTLAKNATTAFVPQCGVAPGLVNIIANELITEVNHPKQVSIYCGALPQTNDNALGYALNWSTDGLINEYGNNCRVLHDHKITEVPGLSNLEEICLHNEALEAFCTSGGIGTLVDTYKEKIDKMSYKALRYRGHCEKMRFLMRDLKLNDHRDMLKEILENALPKNTPDRVLAHIKVDDLSDTREFLPTTIANQPCSAIQAVTATSAATVIDTVLQNPKQYQGPIKQEHFSLSTILNNQHAEYLRS